MAGAGVRIGVGLAVEIGIRTIDGVMFTVGLELLGHG